MPIFYRGAGVGTYWHENDPRLLGFTPHRPGMNASTDRMLVHIGQGTTTSPFVSLTRSFAVAREYSLMGSKTPTEKNPAFVWEIEVGNPLPPGVQLVDPLVAIAKEAPDPVSSYSYQHDGPPSFLLGVVDRSLTAHITNPAPMPPGATSAPRKAPTLSKELQTMVYALRDAEILSIGTIPASCVKARYEIY